MSSDFSPEQRRELLDDFYAECDELITSSRTVLDSLETGLGDVASVRVQCEVLFRHFHSLKGNSAIVGLRSAEELAHGMEELLRALLKGGLTLNAGMLESLWSGTQRLEQIVTAHRVAQPLPNIADALAAVRRWLEGEGNSDRVSAAASPENEAPSPVLPEAGGIAREPNHWTATFSPSAELDRRGVNVTAVRTRLAEVGEIVRATPTVRAGGISFEFLVAVREPVTNLDAWHHDGILLAPAAPPPPARPLEGPAAETAAAAESGAAASLTPSHIVRVDLERLDDLMRILGELVIQRFRLEDRITQVTGDQSGLKEVNLGMARSLRDLREAISRVRMVPIAEIFTRIPLVVRELVRGSPKKVRVVLEGHHTVIDKYLVERLKEPLLHLVRNAFAHGIETAADRARLGKPEEATIRLHAANAGDAVVIRLRDDGRGIDPVAIRERARKLGLPVGDAVDAESVLEILCRPGFSTRDEADLAAGRGVGMAVVASTIRELGGTLALESERGVGTEFILRLPLTLSIAQAVIVAVGRELCAVPQSAIDEIVHLPARELRRINGTEVLPYRGGLLPVQRLRKIFRVAADDGATLTLLVLNGERGSTGLIVDAVRTQREVVVRPLADPLLRVPGISGATELGDGRPLLILDPAAIVNGVVRPSGANYFSAPAAVSTPHSP